MIKKKITCALTVFVILALSNCSTAPKNPGEIYELRKQAETLLELGNKQADRGEFENAALSLNEAVRLGIITDDPSLLLRSRLSLGNLHFAIDQIDEAQASWAAALEESKQIDNAELAAVCRIHLARGKLLLSKDKDAARAVRDEVQRDITQIKKDRLYTAFSWSVIALAEKELGNFAAAETAAKNSLTIHEKDRRFELAGYNWFMIASFRSLSGNYKGAVDALDTAVSFDRRVENSWGLANDWKALGDVHKKNQNPAKARVAYLRSSEIFQALGFTEDADDVLSRMDSTL